MKGEAPNALAKLIECSPALLLEKAKSAIPKARPRKAAITSKANRNTSIYTRTR